jgi:hypothetical protein
MRKACGAIRYVQCAPACQVDLRLSHTLYVRRYVSAPSSAQYQSSALGIIADTWKRTGDIQVNAFTLSAILVAAMLSAGCATLGAVAQGMAGYQGMPAYQPAPATPATAWCQNDGYTTYCQRMN